jgi:alpha-amylase/alpha-mannosidase (GH57 family)
MQDGKLESASLSAASADILPHTLLSSGMISLLLRGRTLLFSQGGLASMGYVCIHGHFYQPPRENPWLEAIELQESAAPYHDWNERIAAECFEPNAAARILDGEGQIIKIVNNYARISFNFGPSLLSWLEHQAPRVYQAILDADQKSRETFSGHGSAIAQAYNHMILPLANRRDKYTQVVWGIRDFEHRFGRRPEGMWLPETAVDLETLNIMAELGLRFTILAPHQARRVRRIGGRAWRDVEGGRIDPKMAYRCRLSSRRAINLFFYDGPVSGAVAFEKLLDNGEHFAQRLLGLFTEQPAASQLAHIATDGETYGHHHRFGEMGLAYALHYIESNRLAQITNYGEYLERHPPTHEVEIIERTAWSCAHGVERWRSNCGCNTGRGWSQEWRTPLREALDWLRDGLASRYEQEAAKFLKHPWAARDAYISVVLDRSPENVQSFLAGHALQALTQAEETVVLKLLEMQRHAMLMYTSCGWFFDELSGIETVQVMQYAGRMIQLAGEIFGESVEPTFLEKLVAAKSNISEHHHGAGIYQKFVKPAVVDLLRLGAHYAISSLFSPYESGARIYCYRVVNEDYRRMEIGRRKLVVGRARFTSEITKESKMLIFSAFHLGDHNVTGGVREDLAEEAYQQLNSGVSEAFSRTDIPEVIRILDHCFDKETYSLGSLFRDEQHRILNLVLESRLAEVENIHEQIYVDHAPLIQYVLGLDTSLPKVFLHSVEFTLNNRLRRALREVDLDVARIQALLAEARLLRVGLDANTLEYTLRKRLEESAAELQANPHALSCLLRLEILIDVARALPFEVDLSKAQNVCYELLETIYPGQQQQAELQDLEASQWIEHLGLLAEKLRVRTLKAHKAAS